MLIPITDLTKEEVRIYHELKEAQLLHYYEPEGGLFIAESPNVIERALAAGYVPVSFLCETSRAQLAESLLRTYGITEIPVFTAPDAVLMQITGFHLTRGMLAAFKRRPGLSLAEILEGKTRIAVLVDVVNPTNIGAIIRSAAALGIQAVLLSRTCSDPLYRRASRVSVGTCFQIPWTYMNEERPEEINSILHDFGFATASLALREDTLSVDDPVLKKTEKLALLLGNEGYGLPEEVIQTSDHTVKIPMREGVDSLNVAAASAVAFWEISKTD